MNSSGEILKKLFLTFNKGERDEFIQVAQEYIEREKRKNHHVLAKQLEEALNFESKPASHRNGCTRFKTDIPIPRDNESGFPLLSIKSFDHMWEELILPSETDSILKQIVQEFREADILKGYNLLPKSKILLCGVLILSRVVSGLFCLMRSISSAKTEMIIMNMEKSSGS